MLAAACALPVAAAPLSAGLAGVWSGTLGREKVMLCINGNDYGDYYGSYYYLRHLEPIRLIQATDSPVWKEGESGAETGEWSIKANGDVIDGSWSKPGQGAAPGALPIHLQKVAPPQTPWEDQRPMWVDRSCGGDAFNAPLEQAPPRVASEAPRTFEGLRYRGLRVSLGRAGQLETAVIEWLEPGAAFQAINLALRKRLDDTPEKLRDGMYFCRRNTLANWGSSGTWLESMEPERRIGPWLVVAERSEADCGGAHPSVDIDYQTFSLETGAELDVWKWIRAKQTQCEGCGYEVSDALNALILAAATRNKGGDECSDAVNENKRYGLRPDAKGLVFTTSFAHVIQACDEDVEVPYRKLLPFLSKEGKSEARRLMAAH